MLRSEQVVEKEDWNQTRQEMIEIIRGEKNDGSATEDGSCVGGAESSDSGIGGADSSRSLRAGM